MKRVYIAGALLLTLNAGAAFAANPIKVEMKNGQFNPATISIPANQKVELSVKNSETAEVEFESYQLNREVKIPAGDTASIFIGPLDAGTYPIFDDNNPNAKGAVVVK